MNLFSLIKNGVIVSPITKKILQISSDNQLLTDKESYEKYEIVKNENVSIPVLLDNRKFIVKYSLASQQMNAEYQSKSVKKRNSNLYKLFHGLLRANYASQYYLSAEKEFFGLLDKDIIAVSIGGGPTRPHPKLINLNIGAFPNVDIVADAHFLPFADASIDAIYCDAVFEHLYNPKLAAEEIYRVLKPGGLVLSLTPFLQAYHGYPHHYQNYTLTGHQYLFESTGFKLLKSGTHNGPAYTMTNLVEIFIKELLPPIINIPIKLMWYFIAGLFIKPFDLLLNALPQSHVLANSTFVLAKKQ